MFERFTHEAKHVVVVAQSVARETGHDEIRAEHLLLAVLTGDGVGRRVLEGLGVEPGRARSAIAALAADDGDADALATLGVDVQEVRRRAEASFGAGALGRPDRRRGWRRVAAAHVPFTASAVDGLDGALTEASRRRSRKIDDGHVLLALLARDQAPAARLLRGLGVAPADARSALEEAMAAR